MARENGSRYKSNLSTGASMKFKESDYMREKKLIEDKIPFSHATLWRKVKSGEFPKPVKLSERITAWKTSEVNAWLESKTQKGVPNE